MTIISQLVAESKSNSMSTGKFDSQLDDNERTLLDNFVIYLTTVESKTDNSARSYRSYVACAIVSMKAGTKLEDMSSDVKSGVKAFARMLESVKI